MSDWTTRLVAQESNLLWIGHLWSIADLLAVPHRIHELALCLQLLHVLELCQLLSLLQEELLLHVQVLLLEELLLLLLLGKRKCRNLLSLRALLLL